MSWHIFVTRSPVVPSTAPSSTPSGSPSSEPSNSPSWCQTIDDFVGQTLTGKDPFDNDRIHSVTIGIGEYYYFVIKENNKGQFVGTGTTSMDNTKVSYDNGHFVGFKPVKVLWS
jgi:hypothetical protein